MNTSNKLIINNVTRLYDKEHGIKSISTVVKPGEIVAIIGPNGAGKTTLVKSIAGLLQVSEGDITLSGISTSDKICIPFINQCSTQKTLCTCIDICHFFDDLKIFYAILCIKNFILLCDCPSDLRIPQVNLL